MTLTEPSVLMSGRQGAPHGPQAASKASRSVTLTIESPLVSARQGAHAEVIVSTTLVGLYVTLRPAQLIMVSNTPETLAAVMMVNVWPTRGTKLSFANCSPNHKCLRVCPGRLSAYGLESDLCSTFG